MHAGGSGEEEKEVMGMGHGTVSTWYDGGCSLEALEVTRLQLGPTHYWMLGPRS